MKNIAKSRKEDADADASSSSSSSSSSFSRLPDEIILEILNKLIDLKTLCCCYLVSKRFSTIVVQVNAIAFTAPDKNIAGDVGPSKWFPKLCSYFGESFLSANKFLNKFIGVKSLCIQVRFSSQRDIDNRCLFKWKVKCGNRIESFIFVSPNSISDKDGFYLYGNGDAEEQDMGLINDIIKQKFTMSFQCLKDVTAWHIILMDIVKYLPMLEEVYITDSERRGRLSLSGEKLSQVKEWAHSASETVFNAVKLPDILSYCCISILNLPVSGYVMKGIYLTVMGVKDLQGGNDDLLNSEDGFEDTEEATCTEAVIEILKSIRV